MLSARISLSIVIMQHVCCIVKTWPSLALLLINQLKINACCERLLYARIQIIKYAIKQSLSVNLITIDCAHEEHLRISLVIYLNYKASALL